MFLNSRPGSANCDEREAPSGEGAPQAPQARALALNAFNRSSLKSSAIFKRPGGEEWRMSGTRNAAVTRRSSCGAHALRTRGVADQDDEVQRHQHLWQSRGVSAHTTDNRLCYLTRLHHPDIGRRVGRHGERCPHRSTRPRVSRRRAASGRWVSLLPPQYAGKRQLTQQPTEQHTRGRSTEEAEDALCQIVRTPQRQDCRSAAGGPPRRAACRHPLPSPPPRCLDSCECCCA